MADFNQHPSAVIDLGCSTLTPVRTSALAMVGVFNFSCGTGVQIDEKTFPASAIHATMAGSWTFHGCDGAKLIGPGTVVAGMADEHYGCAHATMSATNGVVGVLLDNAIDEEAGPLFRARAIPQPEVGTLLSRAARYENDEEFDSRVFEIFHSVSRRSLGDWVSERTDIRMQRVKRFIERNATEDIGLREIAASVNLNPFVCVRQFKREAGITPYAYLLNRRLEVAKQLLKRTNLPVEDVATRVGFHDVAYFCRFFRQCVGLTPTGFRAA